MANKKASKKDILVNKRNHDRNLIFKSRMKTFLKKAIEAITHKTEDKADKVKDALKIIDKTATKGIIHKKMADRKKSRLTKALNKSQSAKK